MQDYVEQRDGGYYIAGTRIALDSIVLAFKDGESPETILRSFPMAGPVVRVYGTVIFYLENKKKVEAYLKDQERLWAEVKTKETELPDALSGAAPRGLGACSPQASLKLRHRTRLRLMIRVRPQANT